MKKYKYLVALDMDGTLLDDNKNISNSTIDYLHSLDEKGVAVVIASGRPYRAIKKYYSQIQLKSPVICYNGGLVFDPNDSSFPVTRYMFSKYIINEIIKDVGYDKLTNIFLENDSEIFIKKLDMELDAFFHFHDMDIHEGDIRKILNKDTYACIFSTSEHPEVNELLVKACFKHQNIGVRFWGKSEYSELYYLNTNKAEGIEKVRKAYNIERSNVFTFGDAENDIEMLRDFENSYLMPNYLFEEIPSYVKHMALDDNNHDGVKKTLESIFEKI